MSERENERSFGVPVAGEFQDDPWREGGEGEPDFVLKTPLELIDGEHITLEVMQRGCTLLGIDPDDVWAGRSVELPEHPAVGPSEAFFELVVENSDDYPPLRRWQWSRANAVLAQVTDHFINASRGR